MTSLNRRPLDRLTVLAVILFPFACGGGGGVKLTPEQDQGASALCTKAASCAGVTSPSSSEMNQCKQQIAGALQIFPDPQAFASCVNGLTCSEIENDEESIKDCVDWDTSTLQCIDDRTLQGCNHAGRCAQANCPDVCRLMSGSFHHCGYDSDRGWDVCWCTR